MAVSEACYATREILKASLDVKETARNNTQVDLAIQSASRAVESQLNRRFCPLDATRYFNWPNWQRAEPWRLWLDYWELAAPATAVTSGGVAIPIGECFFEPVNTGPPYTSLELDRSTAAAFGSGPTPQRDIAITGTFGFSLDTAPAGLLASAVTDTTGTAISATNGAAAGVGDILLIGAERLLLTDKATAATGQTQIGSGCSTAGGADVALSVASGPAVHTGEVLQLDSERMLAVDVTGNTVTVKRGWDGTVPAVHTAAPVYALRAWTVTRGAFGTAAATHPNAALIARYAWPSLITQLALAEAENNLLQGISGYARTVGSADNARPVSGQALADIRKQAYAAYGRKARRRTV